MGYCERVGAGIGCVLYVLCMCLCVIFNFGGNVTEIIYFGTTSSPVSYTHLDVYKRQE